jgi:hypothetical protein
MSVKTRCILAGLAVAAAGLLYFYDPAGTSLFPPCPFHLLTGFYCPGCGSTRAIHQLLHGSLTRAFEMNPLMVLSLPILALLFFRRKWVNSPSAAWCAFAVLLSFGVLRNLNLWPFFLLAPR